MNIINFGQKLEKLQISKFSNPELYLKDFNWLPNWIDLYFNKVSDFLLEFNNLNLNYICFIL